MKKLVIFSVVTILLFSFSAHGQINVYFSPNGGCERAVIDQVAKARSQILVAIYTFTDTEIANALVSAKNNGVRIQILMDKGQASGSYSKGDLLASNGIQIRYSTGAGLMHNKFAIIDTAVVVTGSFNWTISAEEKNAENLLVIKSPELAKEYLKEFVTLWGSGSGQVTTGSKKETGNYLGNANSKKFHRPSCQWAQKISPGNRVWFETREEATNAGYQPCKVCKP
jgi:phosphatidylserine/phosphatidylglycerophosphate/cardiolipin synthase-like enzyme